MLWDGQRVVSEVVSWVRPMERGLVRQVITAQRWWESESCRKFFTGILYFFLQLGRADRWWLIWSFLRWLWFLSERRMVGYLNNWMITNLVQSSKIIGIHHCWRWFLNAHFKPFKFSINVELVHRFIISLSWGTSVPNIPCHLLSEFWSISAILCPVLGIFFNKT